MICLYISLGLAHSSSSRGYNLKVVPGCAIVNERIEMTTYMCHIPVIQQRPPAKLKLTAFRSPLKISLSRDKSLTLYPIELGARREVQIIPITQRRRTSIF